MGVVWSKNTPFGYILRQTNAFFREGFVFFMKIIDNLFGYVHLVSYLWCMRSEKKIFTKKDIDPLWDRYDVGIDPIGLTDNGDCKAYILYDKSKRIMAVVDAKEFDKYCKKFAKYYEKDSLLIDEDSSEFINKKTTK